jgi:LacI family transcriptional regulator
MTMKQHVTLNDVAKAAGVSQSTVSLVLNGRPVVKSKTVEKVRDAIHQLGYVASTPGRRRGRRDRKPRATNRIALLAYGMSRGSMNSAVYMDVIHGVEVAVRNCQRSLMLVHLPPGERLPADIFPQKVDGAILFGPLDQRLARRLDGTPCVQVMGAIEREGRSDQVTYDNSSLGRIAAHYTLERGHRQAAFIGSSNRSLFLERGHDFAKILQAGGASCHDFIDTELLDETGSAIRVIPERLAALLDNVLGTNEDNGNDRPLPGETSFSASAAPRLSPGPGCLFLSHDVLAPAVCSELKRRGLVVGRDIDLISCNNEQALLAHLHPRPATIDIHAERVGQSAVEQLLRRIEHPSAPRATLALQPTLVEGDAPPVLADSLPDLVVH